MTRTGYSHLTIKLLLAITAAALPLTAQTGLGVVRGTVLDAAKAAVPTAKVTLTNEATGVERTRQSSADGVYYLASVPPGQYRLSVEATGFKRWSGTLTMEAGQTVVIEPTLELGSVETTIEVTGAAPAITTTGMEVNDVKDSLRIHQLPLDGRFISSLFDLTPGVEGTENPRVNGMKVGSTEMLLDGISLVDRFGGGMARVQPGLETIQEFRIETAGSSAEYSRPATVILVTKSGTNQFHGSLFATHRNNFGGLRARQRQDYYERAPQYIRNEIGGSAGGPVIKNKTFWFAAYEGYGLRQAILARTRAPTPAMWDGNLSDAIDWSGEATTIYNPFTTSADGTRLPFPNNTIPKNLITPFAETMRSVSPGPAGPNSNGNPFLEDNFEIYYPDHTDINRLTLKGDHIFSESDSISGRFTRSAHLKKSFGGRYGYPRAGSTDTWGTGKVDAKMFSSFIRWNHVFSAAALNELQISNHRSPTSSGTLAKDVPWADRLGLPNPFGETGWPTICADTSFFYGGCWDGDNRKDQMLTAHQLDNNATWIRGRHNVRFGGKVRLEYNNIRELQQAQGAHYFGLDWTQLYDPANDYAVSRTGDGFASLLLGLPTGLSSQYNRGYFYFQQQEFGLYFHDSWKVHPRVTLELGLRWDKWTTYQEKQNRLVGVDLRTYEDKFEVVTPNDVRLEDLPGIPPGVFDSWKARGLTWTTARAVGMPDNLIATDNNNFGPRLGAAFRLTEKWIVRGGFGEYFWTMPLSQILAASRSNPPLNLRFENDISSKQGQIDNYALKNVPAAEDGVGTAIVPTEGVFYIDRYAKRMTAWDHRNWSDNRMREWTFSLERELAKNTALRLSYIGNQGRDLEQDFSVNARESEWNYQARTGLLRPGNADLRRPNPDWDFYATNHSGYSNAHLLEAEIERRYSNGLAFQWFYTFSRALTTSDAGGFNPGIGTINATGAGNFEVPENSQILGAPDLTYEDRLRLGYVNSANVPAHRIRWNGIYDLPFGRGRLFGSHAGRGLNALIGGWQIANVGDWRSGYWNGVSSGVYLFGDPTLDSGERLEMNIFGRRQRLWFRGDFDPAFASGVDQAKLQELIPADRSQRVLRPVGDNFNNRIPQVLANGTIRLTTVTDALNWNSRNFFRGPGSWNINLSLFKTFRITERASVRFTADFFNALNHPTDVDPAATTGLQDLSRQPNDPRITQFTLRVEW